MQSIASGLVISLDFELIWGVRDLDSTHQNNNLIVTRQVVPRLLNLFNKYEIHATWATVGFLFFDSREELIENLPETKPNYKNHNLSPYHNLYQELGSNEIDSPLHYAPSLIQQIIQTPHQELATHTFSHYYCLEEGQTPQSFEADLKSAIQIGKKYNCEIQSIVFPRNQYLPNYLEICANNNIKAYRGNESVWFRTPSKRKDHRQLTRRIFRLLDAYINISGTNSFQLPSSTTLPINVPASRYLRSYSKRLYFLEPLRLRRILSSMKRSAESGQIFHLWWHPEDFSTNIDSNFDVLEKILVEFKKLQTTYGMTSFTMGEIANQICQSK